MALDGGRSTTRALHSAKHSFFPSLSAVVNGQGYGTHNLNGGARLRRAHFRAKRGERSEHLPVLDEGANAIGLLGCSRCSRLLRRQNRARQSLAPPAGVIPRDTPACRRGKSVTRSWRRCSLRRTSASP